MFPLEEVPGLCIPQPSVDTMANQHSVQVWYTISELILILDSGE